MLLQLEQECLDVYKRKERRRVGFVGKVGEEGRRVGGVGKGTRVKW